MCGLRKPLEAAVGLTSRANMRYVSSKVRSKVTSFALFDLRPSVAYYQSRTMHSRSFREESKP